MNLKVKSRYSFEIYPSSVVLTQFKKVTVISTMSAEMARAFSDIDAAHAAYLPLLPPGTPKSVEAFLFYYVQLPTGEKTIVADAWIKESSVQEVQGVRIIAITEDESLSTVAVIRQMYAANGIQVNITVE